MTMSPLRKILSSAALCLAAVGLSSCISSNFSEITAEKSLSRTGIIVGSGNRIKIVKHERKFYLAGNLVTYNLKYENYFSEVHHGRKILQTEDIVHHVHPRTLYLQIDSRFVERIEQFLHLSPTEQTELFVTLSKYMKEGKWISLNGEDSIKEIPLNEQWRIINVKNEKHFLSDISSVVVFLAVDIPSTTCANALFPLVVLYGLVSGSGR